MASISSLRLFSVIATVLFVASFAHAETCEVALDNDSFVIMKGTGADKKYPTIKNLFDSMQAPDVLIEDFSDVSFVDDKGVEVEVGFNTIPTPGRGDPRCKNKKITGYQCRIEDYKAKYADNPLPNGLNSSAVIKISDAETERFERVAQALGCDKTVLANGAPAVPPKKGKSKGAPIKLLPSGGETKR